ncbi:hypothetical protein HYW82_02105 [Candidatus Peregrinibacteria bacterium]|nr:hypothetical protein [Candidatus Peregrinibacteria bacterium]
MKNGSKILVAVLVVAALVGGGIYFASDGDLYKGFSRSLSPQLSPLRLMLSNDLNLSASRVILKDENDNTDIQIDLLNFHDYEPKIARFDIVKTEDDSNATYELHDEEKITISNNSNEYSIKLKSFNVEYDNAVLEITTRKKGRF